MEPDWNVQIIGDVAGTEITELNAEKDKVKEVEKTWKQKYIDRFGEGTSNPEPDKEPEPDDTEEQEVDVHIDDVLYKDLSK